jgi:hypothetical protein
MPLCKCGHHCGKSSRPDSSLLGPGLSRDEIGNLCCMDVQN